MMYLTIYGNTCEYEKGEKTAYDLDMAQDIPVEMIDFDSGVQDDD